MLISHLIISWASFAAVDETLKAVCNDVMLNIYADILDSKAKYLELSQFDENVFYENKDGIYAIVYKYQPSEEKDKRKTYEFGITLVGMDNPIFQEQGPKAFNLQFPVLGLKFAGYFKENLLGKKYNIIDAINNRGTVLAEREQQLLPLKLILRPKKTNFAVRERISFEVELKNVSKKNIWVKELNDTTLFCFFNDKFWGAQTKKASKAKDFILNAGESTSQEFLGEDVKQPGDVVISCSYELSVQGVKPSGTLKVNVSP